MSTTRTLSVALVTALTIGAAQPQAQSVPEGDLLRTWLSAVAQHRPGHADAAASLVAHWSAADVERLLPGLFFYLERVRQTELKNRDVPKCSTCAVSRDERERLLRVTRSRVPRAQQVLISSLPHPDRLDDLLLQAVSLHSDAVMLFPSDPGQRLTGTVRKDGDGVLALDDSLFEPLPETNVLGAPREHIQTSDGQFSGTAPAVPHWYLARALLHFSVPEPPLNAHARRWYLATSAYLAAASDLAQAATHIEIMRSLFPNDAMVMFDSGWLAETHSTPRVQTHLRALLATASRQSGGRRASACERVMCDANGNPNGIKPDRESLRDAERSFARAVALDPSLTEAYVRLAHVQTRLGRHNDAEATLQTVPPSNDPLVNFYAALVRGMMLEALDKLDDAGAEYQKALDLFPTAQSANLSMSALHQKRGDTPMATTYAQRGIDPRADQAAEFDPMVPYRLGRGRHAQEAWAAYNSSREHPR